jgi:hypothetical protein
MKTTGAFSWGILLCKFKDHSEEPHNPMYFLDLIANHSTGSISDYWSSMSYGALDMSGATIYGWITMDTAADDDFFSLLRWDKTQKCVSAVAATLNPAELFGLAGHDGLICIVNGDARDGGQTGNRVLLDVYAWRHTFIAHETGHVLGMDHSFDIRTTPYDAIDDGRPGAYGDTRDIMSAETFAFLNPRPTFDGLFGKTGPGLCALTREKIGWLKASRITELKFAPGEDSTTLGTISAIDAPAVRGNVMYRLAIDGTWNNLPLGQIIYTIEFRPRIGWDVGLPADAVTVRMMRDFDVPRITWSGNGTQDWHVGDHFFDAARRLQIDVTYIADDKSTVSVAIYTGMRAGTPRNMSVKKTLGPRYDLKLGLAEIRPRAPFPSNSVRARLLDNPPQLEGDESMSAPTIPAGSPQFSPQSTVEGNAKIAQ